MPAAKISALPVASSVSLDSLIPVVSDPGGTPETQRATVSSLLTLFRQSIFDVGDLFITVVDVNPASRFGGTWVKVSQGRAIVGVDTGDSDFDTPEKTSGSKTVTLTGDQSGLPAHGHGVTDPGHTHVENSNNTTTGGLRGWGAPDTSTNSSTATGYSTASSTTGLTVNAAAAADAAQAHNNVQPSFAVFVWKRTT